MNTKIDNTKQIHLTLYLTFPICDGKRIKSGGIVKYYSGDLTPESSDRIFVGSTAVAFCGNMCLK